jgi:hypothetical protein
MKKTACLLFAFVIVVLLQSCSSVPMNYYQLFELKSDDVFQVENEMVFENKDVVIKYNFWQEYGISSFSVYNKTDYDLQIDLTNSHLIINDLAKTYFRNSSITESSTSTLSSSEVYKHRNIFLPDEIETTMGSQSGTSITYNEENIMKIPAKSYKIISGFDIYNELIRHCDLLRFPNSKKNVTPVNFDVSNSPVNLRNIVSYSVLSNPPKEDKIINSFFVNTVTNYPAYLFFTEIREEFCEQKYSSVVNVYSAPNRFFIPYTFQKWNRFKR